MSQKQDIPKKIYKVPASHAHYIKALIDVKPREFVVVNDTYLTCFNRKERYQIFYGGSGAGKSYYKAMDLLLKALLNPYFKCAYSRKFEAQIRDSQFSLFTDIIKRQNWGAYFDYSTSKSGSMDIICTLNGNGLIAKGLDNVSKWTSVHGLTDIWIEEPLSKDKTGGGHVTESDFLELDRRLRNAPTDNYTQHIHFTFNPISTNEWIYKTFFDYEKGQAKEYENSTHKHKSTYRDNFFIDRDAEEIKLRRQGIYDYKIFGLGEWGLVRASSPWFYEFSMDKHVGEVELNPNKSIIFTFDFNVDVMGCNVWQVDESRGIVYAIDEFEPCLGIESRVNAILASKYFKYLNTCLVTGDATGNNRSGLVEGETYWTYIIDKLGLRGSQLKVPSSNIGHGESLALCNYILNNLDFYVDEKCQHLQGDLQSTERLGDGGIWKSKYDPHYGDGFRYLCQNFFAHILKQIIFNRK